MSLREYSLLCTNFHETWTLNAFLWAVLALNIRYRIYKIQEKCLYTPSMAFTALFS
jgi:hypothetical protein